MLTRFKRMLSPSVQKAEESVFQAERTPPPSLDVTMQDAKLTGWFQDNGELFSDFMVTSEDSVLDVGCGDGGFITYCARRGAAVTFVDIDEAKIAENELRLKDSPARQIRGLVSDANPLPLLDEEFDKVICTEVMEHVDDPERFLAELVRVGKPGALYLLSVPDPASEKVQQLVAPPLYFEKPHHIRIFSRDAFRDLVNQSGLIVEKQTTYGFFWSIFWAFFWTCDQDLDQPWHPLLRHWGATWETLLSMRDGPRIKQALDEALPKSQLIIARKPI